MKQWAIGVLGALALAAPLGGPAGAQTPPKVTISSASYDLSLRCYQYYDVEGQVAAARQARAEKGSEAANELGKRVVMIKVIKNAWNLNIDKEKGDRKGPAIDADLQKAAEPIVADANASMRGDQGAKDRMEALHAECKAAEMVSG